MPRAREDPIRYGCSIPVCSPDPGSVKGAWFCSCSGIGHSARTESLAAGHNRGKGRKWATLSKAAWRNRVTTGGLHPVGWRVPGQASREEQQQKSISWHLERIWFSQWDLNVITYELVWHLESSHCILLLDINHLLPQARSPWDNDKMKQSKATSSICPSTDKKHGCWATHRTLKHRSDLFSNSIQSRVNCFLRLSPKSPNPSPNPTKGDKCAF